MLLPRAVALLPAFSSISLALEFFSQLSSCPNNCADLGADPKNWTFIHDTAKFSSCNQTVLFDLNLHNDITNVSTSTTIRACTSSDKINYNGQSAPGLATAAASGGCGNFTAASNASVEVTWSGNTGVALNQDRLDSLLGLIKKQLGDISAACKFNVLFSKLGDGTILGLYAGENVDSLRSFDGLAKQLSNQALSSKAEFIVAQHCGKGVNGASTIGLVLSTKGDLGFAQKSLQRLSNATCVDGLENTSKSTSAAIYIKPKTASASSLSSVKNRRVRNHESRASVCSTVQVVSGDSCASLATECGITGAQFSQYNPNICSTLAVGQFVCCSAGSLPDFSPQPGPDGACATYTVQANDFCDSIAKAHFITSQQIESFNTKTWGWQGCTNVELGQVICLSSGEYRDPSSIQPTQIHVPPFPAAVSNAICGPQVPGTKPPADLSTLASMNPCPLNSCCNIFGQCGITPDFCTISQSTTGAPGTSAPGTAGCISNCGTSIVNNGTPPKSFMKVGYWEAFSAGRTCLQMSASQIPTGFTHIHYAFASITPDFQVDTSANSQQFQDFTKTSGFHKILSFGGWSFSTDSDSFPIFRTGVTAANRQTFAQSVVNLVNQYNLDGVDFDWEYPGAPDIPGIPPGSPTDGPNYLAFLQTLRSIMPAGKTISMAAPASYWYLKGFPIKDMAPVLDYIVFMTYDLHGQWDYGSAFSNPGCPTGNCLRSHINSTETAFALSMITKAGVPTNKITVGVSSYGRAFGVSTPGCIGPECLFTGPASGALVGPCTQTAGYLADAEIQSLISQGGVQLRDDGSDSDIVTYADTWVAFMTPNTKNGRIAKYQSQNFAGTVDWALDLEAGALGSSGLDGTGDNPSPTNAPLSPSLTCTTLAPGATFTLTAACAQQIQNLGPLTNGNKPAGPANCTETCDLLRDITGTCCGTGGTIGFPVSIIPNVPLPLGLPLPPGFKPSAPLVIPGYTLKPGQKSQAPIPLPKGFQPPVPIIIPGGVFPPGQPINVSVILPPGFDPPFPIVVGGTTYPAGKPLPSVVPLPPDFVPPTDPDNDPLVVPPFTINPGDPPVPIPVIIPPGWVNPGPDPFPVPPITYPPGDVVPPDTILPPGTILPPDAPPIIIPPGTDLPDDILPPGADDPDEGDDEDDDPDDNAPALPFIAQPVPSPEPDPTTSAPPPPPPSQTPNTAGTNVIINSGCALVDGAARCNANAGEVSAVYQSSFNVQANQGAFSTAIILAEFNTNDKYSPTLTPGCQLNARWPYNFGQVFFGADNCLHDASGNIIDNQCCGPVSASTQVTNPYWDPRPAGSCQRTPFGVGVHFEVYIKGWVTDGGASLRKQVDGCGLVTGPAFGTNTDIEQDGSNANIGSYQADHLMSFNLPITFKSGCVGRAMVSAGAPPGSYC